MKRKYLTLERDFLNEFKNMDMRIDDHIKRKFLPKEGHTIKERFFRNDPMVRLKLRGDPISRVHSISAPEFDIKQNKIQKEDNIFTNLFGFKLLKPKLNKDDLGYNPLKNYTKQQFAVETMQNEKGEQNNLSKVMDEYEAAKDEFMSRFLLNEAYVADTQEKADRMGEESKQLEERSKYKN